MTILRKQEDSTLTLLLEGRLDTLTAPLFEGELAMLNGVSELLLDCEKLEYVSSAGLRVLLEAQKQMDVQGTMALIHVSPDVMNILILTGLSSVLTIR